MPAVRHTVLAWFAGLVLITGATAQTPPSDAPPPPSGTQTTFTCPLSTLQDGFALELPGSFEEDSEIVFQKEPAYSDNQKVERGVMPIPKSKGAAMGFAYDRGKSTLYLDLNRNYDLTDDPDGVYTAPKLNYGMGEVPFPLNTNVPNVKLVQGEAPNQLTYWLTVDPGYGYCSATINSGWSGEIELYGQKWRFLFADNYDGIFDATDFFMIDAAENPALTETLAKAAESCHLPPSNKPLFFGGHQYQWAINNRAGNIELTLTEIPITTAPLTLDGKSIRYMVLEGPCIAWLINPGTEVQIPTGSYSPINIILGEPSKNAKLWYIQTSELKNGGLLQQIGAPFEVRQGLNPHAKAGGPLQHRINAQRSGLSLTASYSLRGMMNESYSTAEDEKSEAPQFIVRKQGQEIYSGQFAYG